MGFIEKDKIIGYNMDGDIWCKECWDGDTSEPPELTMGNYIVKDDNTMYFCDHCDKQLS